MLCIFAIVPLALIGATEYLFVSSNSGTGLYVEDPDELRYYFRSFLGQFFGIFVVVLLGLYFAALDLCVKRMEPFCHLAKEGGALANDSLSVDYFRLILYFSPFLAISHSHWAVVCSSSAAVITTNVLRTILHSGRPDNNAHCVYLLRLNWHLAQRNEACCKNAVI